MGQQMFRKCVSVVKHQSKLDEITGVLRTGGLNLHICNLPVFLCVLRIFRVLCAYIWPAALLSRVAQ
jgi:hypothetical protein